MGPRVQRNGAVWTLSALTSQSSNRTSDTIFTAHTPTTHLARTTRWNAFFASCLSHGCLSGCNGPSSQTGDLCVTSRIAIGGRSSQPIGIALTQHSAAFLRRGRRQAAAAKPLPPKGARFLFLGGAPRASESVDRGPHTETSNPSAQLYV